MASGERNYSREQAIAAAAERRERLREAEREVEAAACARRAAQMKRSR